MAEKKEGRLAKIRKFLGEEEKKIEAWEKKEAPKVKHWISDEEHKLAEWEKRRKTEHEVKELAKKATEHMRSISTPTTPVPVYVPMPYIPVTPTAETPVQAHETRAEDMRKRIEELKLEVEMMKEEKLLGEEEAELKKLMEELHPTARTKLKELLGEIRGTPEQRVARREKIKEVFKGLKMEIPATPTPVMLPETASRASAISSAFEPMEESPSAQFANSLRRVRGY